MTIDIQREWLERWYREIILEFGYDEGLDEASALALANLMESRRCLIGELSRLISSRGVAVIAGAANSLVRDADELARLKCRDRYVLVAADGASSYLMELGLVPDVVVSDLDGGLEALLKAWRSGAVLIVHAHGDNIDRVMSVAPSFSERVEATCQCRPIGHIHNFGGFTDGDRAVFIASSLGARRIVTIGMCLRDEVGMFSKGREFNLSKSWLETKRKKLSYAEKLLGWLATAMREKVEFVDASSCNYLIPSFRKEKIKEDIFT